MQIYRIFLFFIILGFALSTAKGIMVIVCFTLYYMAFFTNKNQIICILLIPGIVCAGIGLIFRGEAVLGTIVMIASFSLMYFVDQAN